MKKIAVTREQHEAGYASGVEMGYGELADIVLDAHAALKQSRFKTVYESELQKMRYNAADPTEQLLQHTGVIAEFLKSKDGLAGERDVLKIHDSFVKNHLIYNPVENEPAYALSVNPPDSKNTWNTLRNFKLAKAATESVATWIYKKTPLHSL